MTASDTRRSELARIDPDPLLARRLGPRNQEGDLAASPTSRNSSVVSNRSRSTTKDFSTEPARTRIGSSVASEGRAEAHGERERLRRGARTRSTLRAPRSTVAQASGLAELADARDVGRILARGHRHRRPVGVGPQRTHHWRLAEAAIADRGRVARRMARKLPGSLVTIARLPRSRSSTAHRGCVHGHAVRTDVFCSIANRSRATRRLPAPSRRFL